MTNAAPGGRWDAELIRSLLFSSISTTYFKITTAATAYPARQLAFTNLTNSNLFITWGSSGTPASDGTDDKIILPSNGYRVLDISTNYVGDTPLQLQSDTIFWVRTATGASDPTSGFVYAEVYYGY